MAYSESLAERIRNWTARHQGFAEKKMFGGVGFLWKGQMCVGVWKTSLIARLGPEPAAAALRQPHVRAFDITGRAMKGWVMVEADGLETDAALHGWLAQALDFVRELPPKQPAPAKAKRR